MEKYYRFAGVDVTVRIPDRWMYEDARPLAPFRAARAAEPHCFSFEAVTALAPPSGQPEAVLPGMRVYREGGRFVRYFGTVEDGWQNAYMRAEYGAKEHRVQVKVSDTAMRIGTKAVLNALMAEHLVAQRGGFVFHCSFVACGEKAILFTAPSGTGKSTQAELWAKHRDAEIINGDRAAVCTPGNQILAEGIPFSGSSTYCQNRSLPLGAVVYLSQAPATSIRKLRGVEAFSKLWQGVSVNAWARQDVERVSATVQQVAAAVPVYHLACLPDESAVIALEEALRKQGAV